MDSHDLTPAEAVEWTLKYSLPASVEALTFGNGVFVAAANNKFYTSTDDGESWTENNGGYAPSLAPRRCGVFMIETGFLCHTFAPITKN